jgi:nitroreductase
MDVFQAMTEMRAMRRIKPDPVDSGLIKDVIRSATHAPTGGNGQNWYFIVVTDEEPRREIGKLYGRAVDWYLREINTQPLPHQSREAWERLLRAVRWQGEHLAEIPVHIFPALDRRDLPDPRRSDPTVSRVSGSSIYPAVQNLMLACRAKGLGATLTTLHIVHEAEVNAVLNLPPGIDTYALIPVGYPVGRFGPTTRLPVEDKIVWQRWPGA